MFGFFLDSLSPGSDPELDSEAKIDFFYFSSSFFFFDFFCKDFNDLVLLLNDVFSYWHLIFLRDVSHSLLQAVETQSLSGRQFVDSFQMNYDLVEVWILLLELFLVLLLVEVHHLLLHPHEGPGVFGPLFLHVSIDHVSEGWLSFDDPNLCQSPDDHVFHNVLKPLDLGHMLGIFALNLVFRHHHNVVQRVRLILLNCVLFEFQELLV